MRKGGNLTKISHTSTVHFSSPTASVIFLRSTTVSGSACSGDPGVPRSSGDEGEGGGRIEEVGNPGV